MTRSEAEERVEELLEFRPKVSDIMDLIDEIYIQRKAKEHTEYDFEGNADEDYQHAKSVYLDRIDRGEDIEL